MLQLISCPVAILAVQTVVSSFCNQANFSAVTKPKSTFLELIDHTRSPPLVSFFGAARKEGSGNATGKVISWEECSTRGAILTKF